MATKSSGKEALQEAAPPLEPCATWEDAEALARDALAYILNDPNEAGGNRIKAAALILARPRAADGSGSGEGMTLEDWLREQPQKSHL